MGELKGGGRALIRKCIEVTGVCRKNSDLQPGVFPITKHFYASHFPNFIQASRSKRGQRTSAEERAISCLTGEFEALRNVPARDWGDLRYWMVIGKACLRGICGERIKATANYERLGLRKGKGKINHFWILEANNLVTSHGPEEGLMYQTAGHS